MCLCMINVYCYEHVYLSVLIMKPALALCTNDDFHDATLFSACQLLTSVVLSFLVRQSITRAQFLYQLNEYHSPGRDNLPHPTQND